MPKSDPLPSWNNSATKQALVEFVQSVTDPGGADFVPPADRIATFDHDGTLWCEQPMYSEMAFLIDQVRALEHRHAEWSQRDPFRAVLNDDIHDVVAGGGLAVFAMAVEVMDQRSVESYQAETRRWVAQSVHPRFGRSYIEMVYQPMRELIDWLHTLEFKVFIVSGGTIDFVRPWSEQAYGIARDRVVGSSVATQFQCGDDCPQLIHLPQMHFVDDGDGKPVGIYQSINRRPILACGNSDGDLAMFEWTNASSLPHHCLVVHHTDAEREYAYDADSPVGRLSKSLEAAQRNGWTVLDMRRDWNRVFAH